VEIQAHILNPVSGLKGFFKNGAGAHVDSLDPDRGISAARFIVVIIQDFIKGVIQLEGDPFAQIVHINHILSSFDIYPKIVGEGSFGRVPYAQNSPSLIEFLDRFLECYRQAVIIAHSSGWAKGKN
jgi:hypothetical protein